MDLDKLLEKANPTCDIPLHLRKASPDLDWKTRFRIIASKASRQNRNPKVYSKTEAPIRDELVNLGFVEGKSFIHEYRLLGYRGRIGQIVYYWVDFFIPEFNLALEADGEVWHAFFDIRERDRNRDRILRRLHGIKVVRFSSHDLARKRLRKKLLRTLWRRNQELYAKGN